MPLIVVDASCVADLLMNVDSEGIRNRLSGSELHAPELLDLEICSVLRRWVLRKELSNSRAEEALMDYTRMPLARHSHRNLLGRVSALRHSLSAYDAAYVALAEAMSATLVTRDRRLARAEGHEATVEVV